MPSTPAPTSRDTRERILDAAEAVFMAHGYEGASMRQITGEAGVNLAAVNYHFGSKEGAVPGRAAAAACRCSTRSACACSTNSRPRPPARRSSRRRSSMPSSAPCCAWRTETAGGATLPAPDRPHPDRAGRIHPRPCWPRNTPTCWNATKQALFRALPDVPKEEIVWRFHFMLGATSYAIAGTDTLRLVTDWQTGAARRRPRPPAAAPDVLSARRPARAAARPSPPTPQLPPNRAAKGRNHDPDPIDRRRAMGAGRS